MIGSPRTFLSCNRHHVCIQLHSLRGISLLLEKASKKSKRTGVTVSVACTNARFNSGLALPLARHAHSHARTLSCFTFFPTDFLEKERLLAIYQLQASNFFVSRYRQLDTYAIRTQITRA